MTNPIAPGQVSQPTTALEQEVRELRRMVEELSRKDLSNANIGQGGRLRGLYANGAEALLLGNDPTDGGNKARISYSQGGPVFQVRPTAASGVAVNEVMEVLDQSGNEIIETDPYAGYGLLHPFFNYTMCGYEELGMAGSTTQATATEVSKNIGFMYNYARHVISRFRVKNTGAATTASAFLEVQDFNGNMIVQSSLQTFSVGASVIVAFDFERMAPLPAQYMSSRVQTLIRAFSPGAAAITIQAMPYMCSGIPKNWYDFYPALH